VQDENYDSYEIEYKKSKEGNYTIDVWKKLWDLECDERIIFCFNDN
jgi:hypothetical protein